MPMSLKVLYANFILAEKRRQREYMESRLGNIGKNKGIPEKQEFRFVDPREYYIDDDEEFINRRQVDGG